MLRVAAPYWGTVGVTPAILTKGAAEGPYAAPLREAGYPVYHRPFDPPLRFAARWVQFLRRHSFDVVHVHTEHANVWVALLAKLAGVPVLLRTVHNGFAFEGRLRRVRTLQRALLRRLGVAHVSVGPSVARTERERFGNPTTLVHNWYDTEHFVPPSTEERAQARREWELSPSDFVVATVGNCSPVKNHAALLEALALLEGLARQPDPHGITYLHVGRSENEPVEVKHAQQLGLRSQVRFLGYVDDVRSVLHAADVFAMPSLFEGYPISAIEAMGAGVPVLFTDVPGLRDLRELSTHIRWAAPTPASLADALAALRAMPRPERQALGQALHDDVTGRLHPRRGVRRYAALYRGELDANALPARRPRALSPSHVSPPSE